MTGKGKRRSEGLIQKLGEVVDEDIGTCGTEVGGRSIAIGDGTCAGTGTSTHEDIDGHVADDEGLRGWNLECSERLQDWFRIGFGTCHIVGTKDEGDVIDDTHVA